MKGARTVDEYIEKQTRWHDELVELRRILRGTELEETVKWGAPCYTHRGKNVVGIGAFQSYFGLWFHQGVLLADPKGVLINAQEGRTKAQRQWRFEEAGELDARTIRAYVKEAIGHVEAGNEIKPARRRSVRVPPLLARALAADAKAKAAFAALSPGKRREYADHIADAKRDETKQRRLEKILPMIRDGKGLNDKYRDC